MDFVSGYEWMQTAYSRPSIELNGEHVTIITGQNKGCKPVEPGKDRRWERGKETTRRVSGKEIRERGIKLNWFGG